MKTYYRNVDIA